MASSLAAELSNLDAEGRIWVFEEAIRCTKERVEMVDEESAKMVMERRRRRLEEAGITKKIAWQIMSSASWYIDTMLAFAMEVGRE